MPRPLVYGEFVRTFCSSHELVLCSLFQGHPISRGRTPESIRSICRIGNSDHVAVVHATILCLGNFCVDICFQISSTLSAILMWFVGSGQWQVAFWLSKKRVGQHEKPRVAVFTLSDRFAPLMHRYSAVGGKSLGMPFLAILSVMVVHSIRFEQLRFVGCQTIMPPCSSHVLSATSYRKSADQGRILLD